jgi:hypothetical protein
MTSNWLPTCWSWPDSNDRDHWVVEGTPLELDGSRKPIVRTMCGEAVPVCVYRMRQRYGAHCKACHDKLTDLIAAHLDGQSAQRCEVRA